MFLMNKKKYNNKKKIPKIPNSEINLPAKNVASFEAEY